MRSSLNIGRIVMPDTPRGRAICRCGRELDYDYGSIRWSCLESDRCPECWAKDDARDISATPRAALEGRDDG